MVRSTDQKATVIEKAVCSSQFSIRGVCHYMEVTWESGRDSQEAEGVRENAGKSLCCGSVGRNRQAGGAGLGYAGLNNSGRLWDMGAVRLSGTWRLGDSGMGIVTPSVKAR